MRAVPRIRMRINVHLCVFAYIFIYLRQMHRARLYSTGPLHIYVLTRIAVVYLKRLTMAIAMVGGGDDTGGSGYTGDRLGESVGTERGEIGKRGGEVCRRKSNRESETVGAASQEKRRKTDSVRGWRKQRDRDRTEEWQRGGIERKQRHQQLPLSGRLAVIMRNKLPL